MKTKVTNNLELNQIKKVMQNNQISIKAKGIFTYLFFMSNENKEVTLTIDEICEDLSIGRDAYFKHIKELKKEKVLQIINTRDANGRFGCNIFELLKTNK